MSALRHVLLVGLLLPSVAWASDVTVIYRKDTKTIAGYAFSSAQVPVEITNLTHSELGGTVSDYGTLTIPEEMARANLDKTLTIASDGSALFVTDASKGKRKADRATALKKLKTTTGLSDDELTAIGLTP